MRPPSTAVQVARELAGLPKDVQEVLAKLASQAAGHNDNNRSCYEDCCRHDADVAKALVVAYTLGRVRLSQEPKPLELKQRRALELACVEGAPDPLDEDPAPLQGPGGPQALEQAIHAIPRNADGCGAHEDLEDRAGLVPAAAAERVGQELRLGQVHAPGQLEGSEVRAGQAGSLPKPLACPVCQAVNDPECREDGHWWAA